MNTVRALVSKVEFRPAVVDELHPRFDLGVLLEFVVESRWVVAFASNAALPDKYLRSLDPLSRGIVDGRVQVVSAEISRILPGAEKVGDVLVELARMNPWAVHVSNPLHVDIPLQQPEVKSAEKVAEDMLIVLYQRQRSPLVSVSAQAQGYDIYSSSDNAAFLDFGEMPAWMCDVKTHWRPRFVGV